MKRHLHWPALAAGLLAVTTTAFAQYGQPDPNRVGGRVSAVDTSAKTISVSTWGSSSTTDIKVGSSTKINVMAQGDVSDIKVGDTIRVMGGPPDDADSTDNIIEARAIFIGSGNFMGGRGGRRGPGGIGGRPGGGPGGGGPGGGRPGGGRFGPPTVGTVTAIDPDLVVKTSDGTEETIDTSDDTRVMEAKTGGLADIKPGTMAMAQLDPKTHVAVSVFVMPGFGHRGGGPGGGGPGGGGGGGN